MLTLQTNKKLLLAFAGALSGAPQKKCEVIFFLYRVLYEIGGSLSTMGTFIKCFQAAFVWGVLVPQGLARKSEIV